MYDNYTKFMDATDLTKEINANLSSDSVSADLQQLKNSLKKINEHHETIDSSLKLKLRKIKKLDMLQTDLDKLRYLSELPEMLKKALSNYALAAKQNSSAPLPREVDLEDIFGHGLSLYRDYSEILTTYKKTKFMQDLYTDIK